MTRHPDLKLSRATGLDHKRATAFNFEAVQDFFHKFVKIKEEKDIPWENIYNMDEKGIQLGGGRKKGKKKWVFSRLDRARCKVNDGSLELVTVIESCCADGSSFAPGFVFAGKKVQVDGLDIDENIW